MKDNKTADTSPPAHLGLIDVFSLCSGAMISTGLFVLPALIFRESGSAVILAYMLAGIMVIPSVLSKAELATAMPKSGGTYFFVHRSLGHYMGTFAGFAGWFSIALKGAFSLVGIGAFVSLIFPDITGESFQLLSLSFVVFFTVINLFGSHTSARYQTVMVFALILILVFYSSFGVTRLVSNPVNTIFANGKIDGIFKMAGIVFVSFGGLTKVAAVAHEIRDPGRNIILGMMLSFVTVILLYIICIAVTINVLEPEVFANTLTPLSLGGRELAGQAGFIALSIAALLAFATTANSSILSAAQNPYAMAADGLIPGALGKQNSKGVPVRSILLTGLFMAVVVMSLDLGNLARAASTMQLLLFLFSNLSMILMRESRIVSYRPLYKAPFYPFIQIFGILASVALIIAMGPLPLLITGIFFVLSTFWTALYRSGHPSKDSALFRIIERMASRSIHGNRLADELSDISRVRDGVADDHFDQLIRKAIILDIKQRITRDELFTKLAKAFSIRLDKDEMELKKRLDAREEESTTHVSDYLAIPHIVLDGEEDFEIVIVRARNGIDYGKEEDTARPRIVFALAGAALQRNFHLKCLMAIAQITSNSDFLKRWCEAFDEEELRLIVIHAERNR